MRLLGLVPPGPRQPHAAYALEELMRRLGVARTIGVWGGEADSAEVVAGSQPVSAERFDGILAYGPASIRAWPGPPKPTVHVLASGFFGDDFESAASVPRLRPQGSGQSPALFTARDSPLSQQERVVALREDWVASTYFLLAGHEERVMPAWDDHGRLDGPRALPARAGFIGRPVVEDYAAQIREAFARAGLAIAPRQPWPGAAPFAALLTADVDLPRRNTWRALASRLLGRPTGMPVDSRSPPGALSYVPRGDERDPYLASLLRLARERPGRPSVQTFFFLSGRHGRRDPYVLQSDPALARQAVDLALSGREIALHAPYDCWLNASDYAQALDSFEAATGTRPCGVRQHFLRFRCPQTWRAQAEAGLVYDASAGFASYEGFRFGTSLPFQAFDAERGRTLSLWIIPLAAMDTTLRAYRGFEPKDAEEQLQRLAGQARRVGGALSLLLHNSSTGEGWRGWEEIFDSFLADLAEQNPWTPTVAQFLDSWQRIADPES